MTVPKRALKPAASACAALILLASAAAIRQGWQRVNAPFELDYGEGVVMWQAANVFDSSRAYGPIDDFWLIVWNYPPLYMYAARAVQTLHGDLLWSGRFVSFLSGLGVAALLAIIVYRSLPRRFGVLIRLCAAGTGVLFLSTDPAVNWSALMRVDWLGLLLTYAGLSLFLTDGAKTWKTDAAFVLFVAALYTRQTYFAAPPACLLAALVMAPRRALRACFVSAVIGGSLFWLGCYWTNGGFAHHLVFLNMHKFSIGRALDGLWTNLLAVRLFLIPAAAIILLSVIRCRRWTSWAVRLRRSPLSLALFLAVLHFVFSFLVSFTFGKVGSAPNYFLEWTAAACLLSGFWVGLALWEAQRAPRWTATVLAALLLPVFLAGQSLRESFVVLAPNVYYRAEHGELDVHRKLLELLRSSPGPVLSDDMVIVQQAGKELLLEPAVMRFLAETGKWDDTRLAALIESQKFALILRRDACDQWWSAHLRAAIDAGYRVDSEIGEYKIHRPRKHPPLAP